MSMYSKDINELSFDELRERYHKEIQSCSFTHTLTGLKYTEQLEQKLKVANKAIELLAIGGYHLENTNVNISNALVKAELMLNEQKH